MTVAAQATLSDGRRAEWHDDLGTVGRYRIVASDGTVVPGSERDYDPFERGQAADRAARRSAVTNDATLRERLRAAAPKIRSAIGEVETIATDQTALGSTRTLATHLATALRANLALGKIITGDLDRAD